MDGTIQEYVLDMAADTKKEPLRVKQYDTNSRQARITLKMGGEPWTIPFGCQIHINVRKTDGTLADAACTRIDEHTVLTPITEQMTAVTGTQLGELYFLGSDGDIKSQSFPVVVYETVMDQARIESSDDFQSLQGALRQVQISTGQADIATQYATEQGDQARDAAQRAEDAAASIQVAVDAAANAKACESNAKNSELAAAQTQQEVTDYVEAQKAAFVGYSKRESDSKYANALTKTVTGEGVITVEDAWTAPVLGLEVVGKSEQVVTTGAQLQPFGYDTITHVGVTLTIKNDLVSLLGTATYSGGRNTLKLPDVTLQAGSYTISVSDAINAVMAVTDDANSVLVQGANIKELKFNIVKETSIHIGFNVISGNVYNITELRIMLNAGDAALPWEPYTGGAPSPSPDYPQGIISTGTVSTGAQMLDFEQCLKEWNSKYTQSSGRVYTVSALGTGFQNPISFSDEDIKVTLSGNVRDISGSKYRIELLDSSGNVVGRIQKDTRSITGLASKIRLNFTEGGAGEYADIMLNTGDTALSWEPYTGGKPSPSVEYPQVVEVGVTGANLFDSGSLKSYYSGTWQVFDNGKRVIVTGADAYSSAKYSVPIEIVRGKTITLFGTSNRTNAEYAALQCSVTSGYGSTTYYTANPTTTVTVKDSDTDVMICLYAHNLSSAPSSPQTAEFSDVMLNYGDTALPWEPCMGCKTATITLTEPLRGTGDYRDRIMCWDGVWGIERWFLPLTFNGSENWTIRNTSITGKHRFVLSDYTTIINHEPDGYTPIKIMCNILTVKSSNGIYTCAEGISSNTSGDVAIYLDDYSSGDVPAFKAYLSTHPISAIFERATPTWDPLPDATQQALNELTTYAGTTHLTITAGGPAPTVTLDYVQDTHKALEQCQEAAKEYTDNQLANIVAALPTATQAAIVDNQTTRLLQEV